jgi:hypothetical protein
MTIRLNEKNSKVVGDKVYITAEKAHKLNIKLVQFLDTSSKIKHPILGTMYEYSGNYSRKNKN